MCDDATTYARISTVSSDNGNDTRAACVDAVHMQVRFLHASLDSQG